MTVNSCMPEYEPNSRLPFGVPLEDIFPRNDIHPYLKNIFVKAHRDIISYGYSIEQIINKTQGSISDRLILKEIVVKCKPMPSIVPPGALLWILRHFIGLLPLPLLPEYTDQRYFRWRRLARFCKQSFSKYSTVNINAKLLTEKLAEELLHLPSPNLLLVCVLLNFIRLTTSTQHYLERKKINKLSAFYLVRYLSSSIFLRPFTPGRNSKTDRYYFPLLLYLVLKWSDIERYFKGNVALNSIASDQLLNNSFTNIVSQKIKIKDNCTQTENFESNFLETINETIESKKEINFLRDTGCQTDVFFEKKRNRQCCCSFSKNYESTLNSIDIAEISSQYEETYSRQNVDKGCQTKEINSIPIKTYASSGCNESHRLYLKTNGGKSTSKHDIATITENLPYCGWITPNYSPKTRNKCDLSSPKTFLSSNEYIYDDYTGSTLNLLENSGKISPTDDDSDIMRKISKIGWTYTPLISPSILSKVESKDENYMLYYCDKEHAYTDEEKEKCSSCDSLKSKQSVGKIASAKSKISFSVGNIKNKLDFLKLFSNKKSKLKNSCSFDEISNIKYKKMNSAKSTLF